MTLTEVVKAPYTSKVMAPYTSKIISGSINLCLWKILHLPTKINFSVLREYRTEAKNSYIK